MCYQTCGPLVRRHCYLRYSQGRGKQLNWDTIIFKTHPSFRDVKVCWNNVSLKGDGMPWELIQRDYPPVAVAPLPSPILNAADGWRGPCIFSSTLRLTCVLSVMHEVIALSLGQVMEALSTTMLSIVSFWQRFQVFSLGHPGLDKGPVSFWRSD